jgi:SPP1 gp7 family putative phage head morphogenesis protein
MNGHENSQISHQVNFERYKTGEVKKLLTVLDSADRQISERIKKTNGVYTKKRLQEVEREIKKIADSARTDIENNFDIEGVVEEEITAQKKIISKLVDSDFKTPTLKAVSDAAEFRPVVSSTFSSYLDSIDSRLYSTWDSAVRTGYLSGQTSQQIVKTVIGVAGTGTISSLRKSLEANTRTMLQSFADVARREVFRENDNLFSGYKVLATLDLRTCLICGTFDGKTYKSLDDIPILPVHLNCRCVLIPIISGYSDVQYEGERAAMDGPEKGNVTYEEWFDKQADERQLDILGSTRYGMYKNGDKIKDFVSGNKILTLDELKENA